MLSEFPLTGTCHCKWMSMYRQVRLCPSRYRLEVSLEDSRRHQLNIEKFWKYQSGITAKVYPRDNLSGFVFACHKTGENIPRVYFCDLQKQTDRLLPKISMEEHTLGTFSHVVRPAKHTTAVLSQGRDSCGCYTGKPYEIWPALLEEVFSSVWYLILTECLSEWLSIYPHCLHHCCTLSWFLPFLTYKFSWLFQHPWYRVGHSSTGQVTYSNQSINFKL